MNNRENILEKLKTLEIPYALVEHAPAFTMDEYNALGFNPNDEICKNLFLRNANGKIHYVVSMLKDKHPDIQGELKPQLGSSRLSFGSDERLQKHLGLHPGEVSPFGIINDENHEVQVVLDSELKTVDGLIGFHPNDCTAFVWLTFGDLMKYINHFGNDVIFVDV